MSIRIRIWIGIDMEIQILIGIGINTMPIHNTYRHKSSRIVELKEVT